MEQQVLLTIKGLQIEGRSGDAWHPIVKGVGLTLHKGEVLGLIGESGAGKSTLGLAAMGFARDGCRISGGTIDFDGMDLRTAPEAQRRGLRGKRIAYVAQSAAASFNPAHKLIDQYCEGPVVHGVMHREKAEADAVGLYRRMRLPNPEEIGFRYPHQVSGGQLQRAMTARGSFRWCSSNFTCLDIAACVRFSSDAAWVKLSCRADASNARNQGRGGI